MTTFAIALSIIAALLLWYALQGRAWLKSKTWAEPFFARVEPIEIFLFKKSETILFARLKIVSGLLLTVLTQLGAIDLTPLMPFVPDQYEGYVRVAFNFLPLIISAMGALDERLRNSVSKPIELVAIAEKDVTPAVAAVIAKSDEVKAEAPGAVADAKAS